MTEISRPWNGTTVGDAGPYSDAHWHQLYRYIIGWGGQRPNVGVFMSSGTAPNEGLRVIAQSPVAAFVDVLPGSALVQGIAYWSDAIESFPIATNGSGNPRIDTVVIQVDYALQEARLTLKQGTAAVSPAPPSLIQTPNIMWELPLADIAVANGFISISQANITPRQEYVNAPPGVYLDNVLNNSGATLEDGRTVVWDNTASRAVTVTTTVDNKQIAGVWRGRAAAGEYGRVQQKGIGYLYSSAAVAIGDILTSSAVSGQAAPLVAIANKVLARALETTSGAGFVLCDIDLQMVRDEEYILIRDEKASGVNGQALTTGGWRQRDLNTEVFDTGGFASVGSNQITLEAGTYEAYGGAPVATAVGNRTRLRDTTGGATLVEASSAFSGSSIFFGQFTITVQSVLQLQHWVASNALGGGAITTGETEKYGFVYLKRKAQTA